MTATATSPSPSAPRPAISARGVSNAIIWISVFLGAFVINEPAPYDLFVVTVVVLWLLMGLKLRREIAPLVVLMMFYMAGGVLALTQLPELSRETIMYMAISGFLVATAIFFAAIVANDPRRLDVIRAAYIAGAVFAALAGVIGYFHLLPGTDFFTLYDRARGTFEDPNVYGPFLVLAAVFLIRDILTKPLASSAPLAPLLLILMAAIFLSFSRASWGLAFVSALFLALLVFIDERDPKKRMRLIVLGIVGAAMIAILLVAALSIDAVADVFASRAKLVQDYDNARLGRFARHALGLQLAMETPLGIGPFEFGKIFSEDPHNIYLKGFLAYGWIGGLSYLVLCGWTLKRLLVINFQRRPWQSATQCVTAVLVGHMLIGLVIDTDHWRHMYLLFGLSWGIIAAEALYRKHRLANRHSSPLHSNRPGDRYGVSERGAVW